MNCPTCKYPATPELDKLKSVKGESQVIGAYLDWLFTEKKRTIAEIPQGMDEWQPMGGSIEKHLAEYFQIDLGKVEQERRAILATLQTTK